jgi:phosphoenolpyruvate synthase/pyruvate phosphate dikinase
MAIRSLTHQATSRSHTQQDHHCQRKLKEEHVIIVDAMVFGNMNANSGYGSVFSRNPETGENNVTGM